MTTFPTEGLDLIVAGQRDEAHDLLEQTHPEGIIDVVGALVERVDAKAKANSNTSQTIATGSLTFTLVERRYWEEGTPVYIMAENTPEVPDARQTRLMVGVLTADENAQGDVNVNVTSTKGSGAFTAWIILSLFAVTATAGSPPYGEAEGGLGADNFAQGRKNLGVLPSTAIRGIVQNPATLSPGAGDVYLIHPTLTTGVFDGHEGEFAVWDGAAYQFRAPEVGERAYDLGNSSSGTQGQKFAEYVFHGTTSFDGPRAISQNTSDEWGRVGSYANGMDRITISIDRTLGNPDLNYQIVAIEIGSSSSPPPIATLPNDNEVARIFLISCPTSSTFGGTINVTGGGTIDGSSFVSMVPGEGLILTVAANSGTYSLVARQGVREGVHVIISGQFLDPSVANRTAYGAPASATTMNALLDPNINGYADGDFHRFINTGDGTLQIIASGGSEFRHPDTTTSLNFTLAKWESRTVVLIGGEWYFSVY